MHEETGPADCSAAPEFFFLVSRDPHGVVVGLSLLSPIRCAAMI